MKYIDGDADDRDLRYFDIFLMLLERVGTGTQSVTTLCIITNTIRDPFLEMIILQLTDPIVPEYYISLSLHGTSTPKPVFLAQC